MTMEELLKDTALQTELEQEIEAKVKDGTPLAAAKAQVLKTHGIEFDEDALKAEAVGRMKLSDEAMDAVSGGSKSSIFCIGDDLWCITVSACYGVSVHTSEYASTQEACWSDYSCIFVNHHVNHMTG